MECRVIKNDFKIRNDGGEVHSRSLRVSHQAAVPEHAHSSSRWSYLVVEAGTTHGTYRLTFQVAVLPHQKWTLLKIE